MIAQCPRPQKVVSSHLQMAIFENDLQTVGQGLGTRLQNVVTCAPYVQNTEAWMVMQVV